MKISQGKVSKSQGLKKKARAKLDRDVSDNKRKNLRKCELQIQMPMMG